MPHPSSIEAYHLKLTGSLQSYLEQLISDSRELRTQRAIAGSNDTRDPSMTHDNLPAEEIESSVQNPLIRNRAWFFSHDASALPRYVSEASSITFAIRLCQSLRGDDVSPLTLPPMRQVDDSSLISLLHAETQWPPLAQAHLLVKTALRHTSPLFHLALRKDTLDQLQDSYHRTALDDTAFGCKYFALFALGEVYSTPFLVSKDGPVPGLSYYMRAMSLIALFPENPSIFHIEGLLALALYSQFLNRGQTAFSLVGQALRAALGCGLNHSLPADQSVDALRREHRVRIWWTIFIFDRFWSCKLGLPAQTHDEDIHVEMPSNLALETYQEQFADSSYQRAAIGLARISGDIIQNIYSRSSHLGSFLSRERKLLIKLKQWVRDLPDQVRLRSESPSPKHVILIHLQFNYCLVLATRPVLLHVLILVSKADASTAVTNSPVLITLGEACIRAARHSLDLCLDEWTDGSSSIYGYAFPHYVFTSGLILIISSLVPFGKTSDFTYVETVTEMLRTLRIKGSLVATDLFEHLQLIRRDLEGGCFATDSSSTGNSHTLQSELPVSLNSGLDSTLSDQFDPDGAFSENEPHMTTEMALHEPLMQEFLAFPDRYTGLLNGLDTISAGNPDGSVWPALQLDERSPSSNQ
ncbi:uncharacterized protein N7482_009888 [Penicillium canariense]|uniref:Xylanolytic transcriptional activator regulatory domain-containing protein n=1 Tax=Penicillium canariense TaxID=189055 RepID=A0A9W9LGQ5_9EURO|nr:uncharacterized protein N7482_009888 [Penicillium canariense]KAJ5153410.1 hypothetical protein N7482_009888 [Penicillium canariense]